MPFPINTMSIAKYEKATDESLRGSIQSTLLVKLTVQTQHQDSLRGCLPMTKSPSKFQLSLICVQKRKDCDHVHSALCFVKQGHMIESLMFHVKINCHTSLNLWSTFLPVSVVRDILAKQFH